MSVFERIYEVVCKIPKGKVATYGQIATLVGNPRLARVVGYALHNNPKPMVIPCHRVVNREGKVATGFAFGGGFAQRELLEKEGIIFQEDGCIDLKKYAWKPTVSEERCFMKQTLIHSIQPIYDKNSKVLILGSFPSQKSREQLFFYGHPQNRFWKVISNIFDSEVPKTIQQKKQLLLENKIAVWDVISSCSIVGSADSTIKNVVANDISEILSCADIKAIFTNGKTSQKYYDKYIKEIIGLNAVCLPSTSPANAVWSFEKLVNEWKIVKEYC